VNLKIGRFYQFFGLFEETNKLKIPFLGCELISTELEKFNEDLYLTVFIEKRFAIGNSNCNLLRTFDSN
jgi:hypothetical protein